MNNRLTVFSKPWPELSLEALGKLVKGLGFDGVEFPVRPGYQVTPENVAKRPAGGGQDPGRPRGCDSAASPGPRTNARSRPAPRRGAASSGCAWASSASMAATSRTRRAFGPNDDALVTGPWSGTG